MLLPPLDDFFECAEIVGLSDEQEILFEVSLALAISTARIENSRHESRLKAIILTAVLLEVIKSLRQLMQCIR